MSYDDNLGRRSGTLTGAQSLADTPAGILSYDLSSHQGRNTLVVIVTVSKASSLVIKMGRGAGGAWGAADSVLPHTINEALAVASGESYPITRIYPLPTAPSCKVGTVNLSNASDDLDYTLDFGARAN